MSTPKFNLRLFPDTGHQFFTVDLEDLFSDARASGGPTPEQIQSFVSDQSVQKDTKAPSAAGAAERPRLAGWLPWSDLTPWILYRYEMLEDPSSGRRRPVLQLAVETNLGDLDRGSLFTLEHIPTGSPTPEHPLYSQLEKHKALVPAADSEVPENLYVARPNTLFQSFEEGWMWLEDAFGGGGNVALPRRVTRPGGRDQAFKLPAETVRIEFVQSGGDRPVDVDLIVDLGNTRTVALLLEDHGMQAEDHAFGRRVEPVKFLPRGWSFGNPSLDSSLEPYGLIDSWIILHRSTFANLEPPYNAHKLRTYRSRVPANPNSDIIAHLIDQRFVALSPVLVGGGPQPSGAAKTLARAAMARGSEDMPFFLSSPKRYAWDNASIGEVKEHWRQVANLHDVNSEELTRLEGLIRFYMNPTRAEHDLPPATMFSPPFQANTDYSEAPKYSRSDAVCWFALAILEAARTQIHSIEFLSRSKLPRRSVLRRLRRVRVTYPSGWTGEEREVYLGQWRRAIKLFSAAHYADPRPIIEGGHAPSMVEDPIDEAIASQLPLLVAEVKMLGDQPETWLSLYGDGAEVKVMNIDIGGGTTDIAVVRYTQPEAKIGRTGASDTTPLLDAKLLDKDGSSIAGDRLVKRIIQGIVIPQWLAASAKGTLANNPRIRELIQHLFVQPRAEPVAGLDADASSKLSRIVRLAFVPMAYEILKRLREAETAHSTNLAPLKASSVADKSAIEELNKLVLGIIVKSELIWPGWSQAETREMKYSESRYTERFKQLWNESATRVLPFQLNAELQLTVADVNALIDDTFNPLLKQVSAMASRHKCDLVILSGKPSELGRVRELIVRRLPLPAQRIIEVKGYRVGSWYPPCLVDSSGRIRDAKTVTVTGAALYEDIKNRNTRGLRVTLPAEGGRGSAEHNWGLLRLVGENVQHDEATLVALGQPVGTKLELTITLHSLIGRWNEDDSHSEPVYRLEYKLHRGEEEMPNLREQKIKMKLELVNEPGVGQGLAIVPGSVSFPGAPEGLFRPERVQLHLRTLVGNSFWMDEPSFQLDLSKLIDSTRR